MDSTKILVLNRGELAEYGKPVKLLENPSGIFSSMVEATGPEQSAFLKKLAAGEVDVVRSLQEAHHEPSSEDNEEESMKEIIDVLKSSQ
jgi:ABC-type proline/glycine betaine transport system ATPase subunit